jgi:hypothetical protein
MPTIQLSEATFSRLKKFADPLVDTSETVIEKMLDVMEKNSSFLKNGTSASPSSNAREFSAKSPPSLTHTKLLSASLGGKQIPDPKWNLFLVEAIKLAKAKARTADELRRLILVNFAQGKKEEDGYHFYPELGLSVQGQDANYAWKGAYHIANQLAIPIEAEFQWRMKDDAAFPGVTGRLSA